MTSGDLGEQRKGPRPLPESLHVYINSAGEEDWARLPGSSAELAAKILKLREEFGGFESVDDLAWVVGDELLDRWRPALRPGTKPAQTQRPRPAAPRQPLPVDRQVPLPVDPRGEQSSRPVGLGQSLFGEITDPRASRTFESEHIIVGIRYRVLVIALLVAGALVLGVGQLHAYQMHRHADLLLERKEEALQADETRRAAVCSSSTCTSSRTTPRPVPNWPFCLQRLPDRAKNR